MKDIGEIFQEISSWQAEVLRFTAVISLKWVHIYGTLARGGWKHEYRNEEIQAKWSLR